MSNGNKTFNDNFNGVRYLECKSVKHSSLWNKVTNKYHWFFLYHEIIFTFHFKVQFSFFSLNLIWYENKHILSLIWAFNILDKSTNILDRVVSITTEKCIIYIFVVLEYVSPVAKYYSGMCINTGKLGLSRYIFVGLLRDCHCTRIVGQ